ncbi:bifunctional tRNA (5-methylaminomethyl-2-thiouridine)(34)-methyltransferase MnmD/FAD-dependent 5-carboxymethylaminomethyl-2-thiouridine(34) oxidoreductase MnmC [Paraglaciecola aquimarina]|uniref:tRNA 5-methylaminomethyl-2-thiouridine biosynthesis bifunctional protein MnmC n=1 Tax=Paraglaciecola algarum TaxID=3050085 RepID=A0ABS9D7K1_9ALTE|nr:bifunctional tRNA (5-methylaminomethyl-2-thiouridine)(34)-methyltransferase MnmD/FAD-dependent 5-carboxymethylaminomethyl-2-thiouridine(34) oxidoreductase MnmC [Paraglaciecola sp. G1-23]MCF2947992.1 bifunctional tRNA (5-methylaminomethyl-2-thiouridine)(34)-methyltransferase MnmD/FAD-dependent 5-carboxymethylaminomethyl-2-thiouridine(34) oxidoreductase MnmC [Paraglaciecola sp. G1-23]
MSIKQANIEFNENGAPVATEFADIYFSDAGAFEETQHVFLSNNSIPLRWETWPQKYFTIAETGFGTGLNFLITLKCFSDFIEQQPDTNFNLHFISIEKFPISLADLKQALAVYPELQEFSNELLNQYPEPIAGCHRLHFLQNRVTLDLWLGDVHQVLPQINDRPDGIVDAWYLDGFAPSKNPDMWTQSLFEHMARLATECCTFATFTAAGFVRRGLIQAGFDVQKRPGHGRKREMLAGQINKKQDTPTGLPYFVRNSYQAANQPSTNQYYTSQHKTNKPSIAIIGGGIAGANCAYALAKKGLQATIYCKESQLAQGASGNPQGGFYPQLNAEASVASQIQVSAFTYAARLYKQLLADGFNYSHDWCGTLLMAFNDKVTTRYQKMVSNQTWPESLIHWVDNQQASDKANMHIPYSGLFVPSAGWINPPELTQALIKAAQTQVITNHQLMSLDRDANQWCLTWQNQTLTQADIVIFTTGSDSVDMPYLEELPFRLVRGQVEAIPTNNELDKLSTVLCHKGYFTPNWQGHHALGSTYVKEDRSCEYRQSEQSLNLGMHQRSLDKCDWIHNIQAEGKGRAAIRASTPDHLPMVGAVPNVEQQKQQYQDLYKALPSHCYPTAIDHPNLFMLTGLGSRGLSTAPLSAEILASQITGQALPLSDKLLDALNPNRFLIRALIRRQE